MDLLDSPIIFQLPLRQTAVQSWHRLVPLAFAITEWTSPRQFVELGTHMGDSYCAFCQAVTTLRLDTRCTAVDTWQGDPQAGIYDDSVLKGLKAYHDPLYGSFSRLNRSTFDEALSLFADGSVDLLHIDGLHTYEAVKHDFTTWLPKMSDRGIILFHDTDVYHGDFGVYRLWAELSKKYPAHEFKFGNGLGVLAVGSTIPERMKPLFEADAGTAPGKRLANLDSLFQAAGERCAQNYKSPGVNESIYRNKFSVAYVNHMASSLATRPEARDYIRGRLTEMTVAPLFLSSAGQALWQAQLRLKTRPLRQKANAALVAHVFYPDLMSEIIACWKSLPAGSPLHITTLAEHRDKLGRELLGRPDVFVHIVENRGRDIAPFIGLLNAGELDGYDTVLKLHTKRSPHLRNGDQRRRLLFTALAGNPTKVTSILNLFADPKTGMVGWSQSYRRHRMFWMANQRNVARLAMRMDNYDIAAPSFFEGSMFWLRPRALAPLKALGLTTRDFEPEQRQTDGMLHHAIERVFNLAAVTAGYRVLSDAGTCLLEPVVDTANDTAPEFPNTVALQSPGG